MWWMLFVLAGVVAFVGSGYAAEVRQDFEVENPDALLLEARKKLFG